MKLTVTMEVEFSDLPDDVRDEMADGINFRAEDDDLNGDLETVPKIDEMEPYEVTEAVSEFLEGLGDYDAQAEAWAGSSVFGYLSSIVVKSIEPSA